MPLPYIRVHAADNVAILPDPEGVRAGDTWPDGLRAQEPIPQSQKIALGSFRSGDPVIRYGQIIGHATRDIPPGAWVRHEFLDLPQPPPLDQLPLATATPSRLCRRWKAGPLRGTGIPTVQPATRNLLGITTTVQCVAPTVDYAVRRIRTELLPRFRNVDDVVSVTHTYGCGVAIDAPGAAIPIRTIRNISLHPNIGAEPLIVSLGCEKLQPSRPVPARRAPEL